MDVFPPPEGEHDDVRILSRRDDLVAVAKPAGLSTIPDQRGKAASLSDAVAHALGLPDATAVHATSRLDRLVSGVVVFALSRQAREAASRARSKGSYRRHYVALGGPGA